MPSSPHLLIDHVADTAQKAPVQNEMTDLLDRAMNGVATAIDVTAGGQIVITDAQIKQNFFLKLTGTPAAALSIVVPVEERTFALFNQVTSGVLITVETEATAGTWDTLAVGERAIFSCDGENVFKIGTTHAGSPIGLVETFSGMIEAPGEKTYTLEQFAKYGYVINDITGILIAGGLSVAIEINGTPVTGLENVIFTTAENTDTSSGASLVVVGDTVTMVVTDLDTDTAEDFAFSMQVTRT